jgi:hypothetical protein
MEFIETYGVPTQARVFGRNLRLITMSQDGDTFECSFRVLESFGKEDFIVFNVCKKLYPFGASVKCLDDCGFLCARSLESFKVFPTKEGVVKLLVSKRMLPQGKRRSVDDQIHLNSSLMQFEEDYAQGREEKMEVKEEEKEGEIVVESVNRLIGQAIESELSAKFNVGSRVVVNEREKWRRLCEAVIIVAITILLVVLPLCCE